MKVPEQIEKLIERDIWKATPDCILAHNLKNKYGWCGSIDLYPGPDFSDGGIIKAAKGLAKNNFGVYLTGEHKDDEKPDHIDGNKCIMIACNWDEEAICLDFRFSDKLPRVMASDYSKSPSRWVEVALSIDEFIKKLGIKTKDNTV